ncbi:hypothetical protein HAX54_033754 [Datura stramonium]|uniref:CBS domain-containing protein n=1 Tax=Datura stramonium TaxID=4076 RepID=A0ABS8VEF1_DATST|nr:hypothetical protein [Datura stramonium]
MALPSTSANAAATSNSQPPLRCQEKELLGFRNDDDWKLVGVALDYDLLALDTISGIIEVSSKLTQICFLMLTVLGRLLLQTKYRRLPVVDVDGKLVGDYHKATLLEPRAYKTHHGEYPMTPGSSVEVVHVKP